MPGHTKAKSRHIWKRSPLGSGNGGTGTRPRPGALGVRRRRARLADRSDLSPAQSVDRSLAELSAIDSGEAAEMRESAFHCDPGNGAWHRLCSLERSSGDGEGAPSHIGAWAHAHGPLEYPFERSPRNVEQRTQDRNPQGRPGLGSRRGLGQKNDCRRAAAGFIDNRSRSRHYRLRHCGRGPDRIIVADR